jgi:predicted RNA-binding protein (TIGR00451 family)
MLSVSFMDGYRTGTFTWNKKSVVIPNLVTVKKDIVTLETITIERPTVYKKEVKTDLKTVSLLKIPYHTPRSIAAQFSARNIEFLTDKDACPVYVSRYNELNKKFLSNVAFYHIFFLFCPEERKLLKTILYLRKKYPQSLLYTRAHPEEIPVLATAGVDLFNYTESNERALQNFLEHPEKHHLEKECNTTVRTKRLLRILYREFYNQIEKYTAFKQNKSLYISTDALYRPEVQKFRQKIAERYIPPSRVCVLLPCSAKKPYRKSQSHQRFMSAIPKNADVTQLILTSPLGVVPRELEDYVNYDIPVTGHWSHEEITEAAFVLNEIIKKVKDPIVYAHIPQEYIPICDAIPFDITNTVVDHPLSEKSLKKLKSCLKDTPKSKFLNQKMRAVSQFLFDEDIFPEYITIKRRRRTFIVKSDTVLAEYTNDLKLTQKGADLLTNYTVTIDFDLKGDVFCPGVLSADSRIRPREQVVIKRDHAVGVGRAVVPGDIMTELEKGCAVKVSKRFHNARKT